jgi:hypothetical protein
MGKHFGEAELKEEWLAWAYLPLTDSNTELRLSATVNRTHVHTSQFKVVLFPGMSRCGINQQAREMNCLMVFL